MEELAILMLQSVVSGLLIGGVWIVITLGLDMLVGVLRITNFAQGDLVTIGMYLTYFVCTLLQVNMIEALVIVPLIFAGFGILLYFGIFRVMVGKPFPPQLLYTSAMSIAFQNALLVAFTSDARDLAVPIRMQKFNVGPIAFNILLVIAFAISVTTATVVYAFLYKTERGRVIRATMSNRQLISLLGINSNRIYLQSFCLAMGLTGLGSALLMFYYPVFPTVGSLYTLLMFVSAVLGGIGTIRGAILGGLIVGVTQIVSSTLLYVNFQNLAAFTIFLIFAIIRPKGILGGR